MDTKVASITGDEEKDNKIFAEASEILRKGGLVAFPTETVYGLGADALNEGASAKIYAAKGRPSDNPLIVHIAELSDMEKLAVDIPELAYKLAGEFWPGPMTMVLKKAECVPDSITGGLSTVAIRMPVHETARRLIRESGVYIAAPSANTSGKPSPTKAEHVIGDLSGKIDMIICDDTVDVGVESTIVDLSEDCATILRPGYITLKDIERVAGEARLDPGIMEGVAAGVVPKAPGMKYKHYAPNARITIVEGDNDKVVEYINKKLSRDGLSGDEALSSRIAVLATEENSKRYNTDNVYVLSAKADEVKAAKNLYRILRDFDRDKVDIVYSESFPQTGVGLSVMNRLIKAAGHTIVRV